MAYLSRNERRSDILEAVIGIAAEEGFGGVTVRRISAKLNMSAGNVHHIFDSAAEIKRDAFKLFSDRALAAWDREGEKLPPMQRLVNYLVRHASGDERAVRRVWSSAAQEAADDAQFAELYALQTNKWLDRVAALVIELSSPKMKPAAAEAVAWRLASASVGLSSFANSMHHITRRHIEAHITELIAQELDAAAAPRPTKRVK